MTCKPTRNWAKALNGKREEKRAAVRDLFPERWGGTGAATTDATEDANRTWSDLSRNLRTDDTDND